jgi:hypothetical protein
MPKRMTWAEFKAKTMTAADIEKAHALAQKELRRIDREERPKTKKPH